MKNKVIQHAQQSFKAMQNPFKSVVKTYPQALNEFEKNENTRYLGVKNVMQIPAKLLQTLYEKGDYVLHTKDQASSLGRAIDIQLRNPITGNYMSGSSSGTAINVFLGINELGIGTDGGGSVLAPAMSLQCFGFISELIEQEHMSQFNRISTDQLSFTPSIGFITRNFQEMKHAISCVIKLSDVLDPVHIRSPKSQYVDGISVHEEIHHRLNGKQVEIEDIEFPIFNQDRTPMINFLKEHLPGCDCLISYEAKIDVFALGDSVLGHFDKATQEAQIKSGKFLIRVANMVNATALCVPSTALASGFILICESKPDKISKMLQIAEHFICEDDQLLERYFRDANAYFCDGFLEDWHNL